jgi:hypothetical protein
MQSTGLNRCPQAVVQATGSSRFTNPQSACRGRLPQRFLTACIVNRGPFSDNGLTDAIDGILSFTSAQCSLFRLDGGRTPPIGVNRDDGTDFLYDSRKHGRSLFMNNGC